MATCKIELKITGQLIGPGYLVSLEGHEIILRESAPHEYTRTYEAFPVEEPLDVLIVLRGWYGTNWTVDLKVDGTSRIHESGKFPKKGTVNIPRQIELT